MFKFANLKLYRKFIIIGVLLAAFFVVSSTGSVGATPCCDACMTNVNNCIAGCYNQEQYPGFPECLEACGNYYEACSRACGHGIPVCPAI